MAKGYQVGIASETKAFKAGIQSGVIAPLEDAQDELTKLGKNRGADQLERGMKDAQDATEDLSREIETTRRDLERMGRAAKDAGDDARKGMDRASDGVKDFKGEAQQTARETAASFDGSAESIGDMFQEVAANAFGGFGPAGAAAGLAAAAGIGLATQAFTDAQDAAAEAKEEAYSYAFAVLDSGKIAAEASAFRKITEDTERMAEAQKIAKATSTDLSDVIKALATGDGIPALIDGLQKAADTGNAYELNGLIMMLQGAHDGFQLGADGAAVFSEYMYDLATAAGTATGEVDYLGRQIVTLPDGKEVVIDAATRTASENITRVQDDLGKVPEVVNSTVKVSLDDSAIRNYKPPTIKIPATFETRGRQLF